MAQLAGVLSSVYTWLATSSSLPQASNNPLSGNSTEHHAVLNDTNTNSEMKKTPNRKPKRKRRQRYFLHLPSSIRCLIYSYIFVGSEIQVCGFNKDHSAEEFAKDERCQILLTCRSCYKEAMPLMYRHTHFKLTKVSALQYFTWDEADQRKTALIVKITITQLELVDVFSNYLRYFGHLKHLIIDLPVEARRSGKLYEHDYFAIARSIGLGPWFKENVRSQLPLAKGRRYDLGLVIHFICELEDNGEEHEICLVQIDRMTITRNYRPLPMPGASESLEIPSAGDADPITSSTSEEGSLDWADEERNCQ